MTEHEFTAYSDMLAQEIEFLINLENEQPTSQSNADDFDSYVNTIRSIWNNESWESIVEKFQTEGSTWIVWWQDGVINFYNHLVSEASTIADFNKVYMSGSISDNSEEPNKQPSIVTSMYDDPDFLKKVNEIVLKNIQALSLSDKDQNQLIKNVDKIFEKKDNTNSSLIKADDIAMNNQTNESLIHQTTASLEDAYLKSTTKEVLRLCKHRKTLSDLLDTSKWQSQLKLKSQKLSESEPSLFQEDIDALEFSIQLIDTSLSNYVRENPKFENLIKKELSD